MPRIVDHEVRRREIAAALWRIVRRDGIEHVSVRSVAAEAGTSPGALRHYFASNDELAAFSLRAVVDAATERLQVLMPGLTGRTAALALLEQYLPIDEVRRAEFEVFFGFMGRPPTEQGLRGIRAEAEQQSRRGVAWAVDLLDEAGLLHPDRSPRRTVDMLYPLVDGLAMHGTLWPERYPVPHLRRTLRAAVDDLASPPPG